MTAEDASSAPAPDLVTKASIRTRVWDHLEKNDLVNYPRPVTNRIPNFKGAAEAGDKAATLEVFTKAQTIKINPDKPQEQCRFKVLEMNKRLLVPTPRLRAGLFNKINPPAEADKDILRTCSTSQGIKEYSSPISLEDKVKVDLVIVGSVAVTKEGLRIGKGEGYADMEFAMMTAMGAVNQDTIIVTTVHDDQIVEFPESLKEDHDIAVDFIVTPTKIIQCPKRPKPTGIIWSKITLEKIRRVPILRKLREMEREAGKDVQIYEDIHGMPEKEEGDDRGDYSGRRRGYARRRPRVGRGRGGGRGGRRYGDEGDVSEGADGERDYDADRDRGGPRRRGRGGRFRGGRGGRGRGPRGESTGEDPDTAEEGDGDGQSARGRRFRRRRGGRRRTTETDGEEVNENGEGGEDDKDRRGPNRRRRRRRSENGPRDSAGEEGDDPERRRRPRKRGPALFVGSLPRRLRVSEFKSQVRNKDVNPMRVIWRGNLGHAFLQFDVEKEMEDALDKLQGLHIGGRDLRVEPANSGTGVPPSPRGGSQGGGGGQSGPESGDE